MNAYVDLVDATSGGSGATGNCSFASHPGVSNESADFNVGPDDGVASVAVTGIAVLAAPTRLQLQCVSRGGEDSFVTGYRMTALQVATLTQQ